MARIGHVVVGENSRVKVMGIINASPESFYKQSVKIDEDDIAQAAARMEQDGASIIDIGAMSTAPYLDTVISEKTEISRMRHAIKAVRKSGCTLSISADTPRSAVAQAALDSGADAINDVTGLKYDAKMSHVISSSGVPVIIGAYGSRVKIGTPNTQKDLKESILVAKEAGIKHNKIIVDPSIGFYRAEGKNPFYTKMTETPWYTRDLDVLSKIDNLARLGPVCISVSGKSFLGHLLGIKKAKDRVVASIACEVYCAQRGVSLIRTHNVKASVQAQVMLELLAK